MKLSRRTLIKISTAIIALPRVVSAAAPREITWDDLIPPGVPYSEIIAEGELDEENDYWRPIFDENSTKLNPALADAYIKMPGFIIPIDISGDGVTSFILVPYVGACIHVPPPPPNQLVFVTTKVPWPSERLWEAVWVTGTMQNKVQYTEVADTGYELEADWIEIYIW
ncbi:MAG: DUF3299 domain-containing protein [Planktomarina sp.]|jgi:hypothetical protein|nr:DUF3299 domain-containing protein [Planktomarina sp.]